MRRSIRAPNLTGHLLAAALLWLFAAGDDGPAGSARAQEGLGRRPPPELQAAAPARAEEERPAIVDSVFQVLKRFDFDERPLGNYGEIPMHWRRLTGAGLPRYSAGRFDDEAGRAAPPSFALRLQGGNVCYEYRYNDLIILPDADYLLVGYVRAVGLRYAQAFIHTYLVDRLGTPIPGSDQVSRLVRSQNPGDPATAGFGPPGYATVAGETAPAADEPWQRLEIALADDFPAAYALRLRLWVLQSNAWQPPEASEVAPIIRQDVRATVWFDDITIYRLPRARLYLSNPAGLVLPGGEATHLVLDVRNPTPQTVAGDLAVLDVGGRELYRARHEAPPHTASPVPVPLPVLEPGLYEARLWLRSGEQTLLYRATRFAVLPELPPVRRPAADCGVDLGRWRAGDPAGAVQLVKELGCGAAKVGVPMIAELDSESKLTYAHQVRELARELIASDIHTTGVLLASNADTTAAATGDPVGGPGQTIRQLLANEPNSERWFGPLLSHLGGLVSTWQLGDERVEAAATPAGAWNAAGLAQVRRKFTRFVKAPDLVLPQSVFDPRATGEAGGAAFGPTQTAGPSQQRPARPHAVSIWVPPDVPARCFARQLAFLAGAAGPTGAGVGGVAFGTAAKRWLLLDAQGAGLTREQRLADCARRLVLAKALGPERLYIRAPFELSPGGGQARWQPTEEYIIVRTLLRSLSGKQAVAARTLPEQHGVAIIFDGPDSTSIVLWTWRDRPPAAPVELYLGPNPVATDLWGRRSPLALEDRRAQVRLAPLPIILDNIDAHLALLQASFRVEPASVQLHQPEPRPVLQMRNYYAAELAGQIHFTCPANWRLTPALIDFKLEPGEALEHTLYLELPPWELAAARPLGIRVELNGPVSEDLEFIVPITVELRDILVEVKTRWSENNLIVEQSLLNLSPGPVSFNALCRAPGRALLERAFLNVGPGQTQVQTYSYANARDLVGSALRLGVREIDGRRSLDQLVEIPD